MASARCVAMGEMMQSIHVDTLSTIYGGKGQAPAPTTTPTTTPPTTTTPTPTPSTGPSLLGNICRAGYTSLGAAVGATLAGWGAVPGAVVGAGVGYALCPP